MTGRPMPGDALLAELREKSSVDRDGAAANLRAHAQSFAWQVQEIERRHHDLHSKMWVGAASRAAKRKWRLDKRRAAAGGAS